MPHLKDLVTIGNNMIFYTYVCVLKIVFVKETNAYWYTCLLISSFCSCNSTRLNFEWTSNDMFYITL